MSSWFYRINTAALLCCLVLVPFGAYVRLSNAGLGCPDWPGCYGHAAVPDAPQIDTTQPGYQRPLEAPKAWKEMLHRYLAGIVGLLVVVLAALAPFERRAPRGVAFAALAVFIVQVVFGALTVTMKVNPLIVTTHLLLGLTTLSLLGWMWLRQRPRLAHAIPPAAPWWSLLALAVLVVQIVLGGWTSTNYAALACPDFPQCQGSLLPGTPLADAFTLWHGHQVDYEFGVLDVAARGTVQLVHRYGALLVSIVVGSFAIYLLLRRWRIAGGALLAALALQLCIGVGIVYLQLPLWLADAHNAGAMLLLLTLIAVAHYAWTAPRAAMS
jgi:cytochrome c oxidase assembly protein subunit 15